MIVGLDEMKAHLRVEHSLEDVLLESLITQAQSAAEDFCRVKFDTDESAGVPEPVRLAVMLMVSYFYENRDVSDATGYNAMKRAFEALLYPHRDPKLLF